MILFRREAGGGEGGGGEKGFKGQATAIGEEANLREIRIDRAGGIPWQKGGAASGRNIVSLSFIIVALSPCVYSKCGGPPKGRQFLSDKNERGKWFIILSRYCQLEFHLLKFQILILLVPWNGKGDLIWFIRSSLRFSFPDCKFARSLLKCHQSRKEGNGNFFWRRLGAKWDAEYVKLQWIQDELSASAWFSLDCKFVRSLLKCHQSSEEMENSFGGGN